MLLGRHVECERIDQLLEQARAGHSGVLLIRGEAGIGKSALCEYGAEQAQAMTVLRARGVDTESELAFSGLAELLQPTLGHLEEIPKPQAAALAAALAIGPPVHGDRFTICAATLSLVGVAADAAPILAIVDDAQWLDASSAEALLFVTRRLEAECVALLFVVRDGHATLFDRAALPEIRPSGLDRDAAGALLASREGPPIAPEVAERLASFAAGNPLVLVEVPALLSEGQLAGAEPLDEELLAAKPGSASSGQAAARMAPSAQCTAMSQPPSILPDTSRTRTASRPRSEATAHQACSKAQGPVRARNSSGLLTAHRSRPGRRLRVRDRLRDRRKHPQMAISRRSAFSGPHR
jgi:AAA ATPase domain